MTLPGCRMPAGPVSSPFRSDILGFLLPAQLTETEQIRGHLQSPLNESARSDAAAAEMITRVLVSQKVHITLQKMWQSVFNLGSWFILPAGESRDTD